MKPNNSTLQIVGFSLKSTANIRNSHHFTRLLTAFFLFISFVSFAGGIKKNTDGVSVSGNYTAVLKGTTSPLTGPESIRTNLYLLNADNTTKLADGVLTEYN